MSALRTTSVRRVGRVEGPTAPFDRLKPRDRFGVVIFDGEAARRYIRSRSIPWVSSSVL